MKIQGVEKKIPKQLINLRFCRIKNKSKAPFEKNWVNQTYSYSDISKFNNENYGVVCGYHDLVVIDCDNQVLEFNVNELLPKTFSVKTGSGGKHFYYFIPELKNKIILKSDEEHLGEIQSYGSQVVGPTSIHPNGKEYQIIDNVGIQTISFKDVENILGKFIAVNNVGKNKVGGDTKVKEKFYKIIEQNLKIKRLFEGDFTGYDMSYEGEIALVCHLIGFDFDKKEIFEIMSNCKIDRWLERGVSYRENTYKKALGIIRNKKGAKKINVNDFFTEKKDKNGKTTIGNFITKKMADYILESNNFKVVKGNDKQIYYYSDGYYKEGGTELIRKKTTNVLGSLFKDYFVKETISYIRNLNYIDIKKINKKLINLKNGLLDPITREFIPHDPEIFSLNQLPINYDPDAKCDFFKEELKKRCDKDWKYKLIQEMFGYCFSDDDELEKAFLLYGERRTMKSTTLFVLENLLGSENITSMSLQQITEDKHAPAFLLKSVANICAELSPRELRNTNMFMKIVGRDSITAGKKFEQEITFRPQTKLLFSCNSIPSTSNKNLAFYRRWVIIEFNVQTREDDVDIKIRKKFIDELSGVLNWSLEGLDRIIKNQKLSYPLTDQETKDLYEKGSDSVQSFIFNKIDCEDDEGKEIKRNVRKEYLKYCEKEKLDVVNEILFGRRFIALTGCGTQRIGWLPAYSGIKIQGKIRGQKRLK